MRPLREMLTVDADAHVLEPADLWLRYIEPEYRERALHVRVDADGLESLYVEGEPMRLFHGTLGSLGGIEETDPEGKRALQTPGARTYADGSPPGGYDPHARLEVMDATALTLCLENNLPIVVFGVQTPQGIERAAKGELIGTLVSCEG